MLYTDQKDDEQAPHQPAGPADAGQPKRNRRGDTSKKPTQSQQGSPRRAPENFIQVPIVNGRQDDPRGAPHPGAHFIERLARFRHKPDPARKQQHEHKGLREAAVPRVAQQGIQHMAPIELPHRKQVQRREEEP